jgi:hypothetical protein
MGAAEYWQIHSHSCPFVIVLANVPFIFGMCRVLGSRLVGAHLKMKPHEGSRMKNKLHYVVCLSSAVQISFWLV